MAAIQKTGQLKFRSYDKNVFLTGKFYTSFKETYSLEELKQFYIIVSYSTLYKPTKTQDKRTHFKHIQFQLAVLQHTFFAR